MMNDQDVDAAGTDERRFFFCTREEEEEERRRNSFKRSRNVFFSPFAYGPVLLFLLIPFVLAHRSSPSGIDSSFLFSRSIDRLICIYLFIILLLKKFQEREEEECNTRVGVSEKKTKK